MFLLLGLSRKVDGLVVEMVLLEIGGGKMIL